MNLFIDTSSLIKLYHKEYETDKIIDFISNNKINSIYLSSLTKIEFLSAVWKKIRTKEIDKNDGIILIKYFETDKNNYRWLSINNEIIDLSKILLEKYGLNGLRTLDSIQFATALSLKSDDCINVVSDKLLKELFVLENLKVF